MVGWRAIRAATEHASAYRFLFIVRGHTPGGRTFLQKRGDPFAIIRLTHHLVDQHLGVGYRVGNAAMKIPVDLPAGLGKGLRRDRSNELSFNSQFPLTKKLIAESDSDIRTDKWTAIT